MTTINQKSPIDCIVENYKNVLSKQYGKKYLKQFKKTCRESKNAAELESIMFFIMRKHFGFDVEVSELKSSADADFTCIKYDYKFMLEVTHLKSVSNTPNEGSIEKRTGLSYNLEKGGCYNNDNEKIILVIRDKDKQLENAKMPGLTVIGTFHVGEGALNFRDFVLEKLLYLSPKIGNPKATRGEHIYNTKILLSCFYNITDGKTNILSQNTSAVLFAAVYYDYTTILGVLHPEPKYKFDTRQLYGIPFCRISQWPISEAEWNNIRVEWTTTNSNARVIYHSDLLDCIRHY